MNIDYVYLAVEFSLFICLMYLIYLTVKRQGTLRYLATVLLSLVLAGIALFPISTLCACDNNNRNEFFNEMSESCACKGEERILQVTKLYQFYVNGKIIKNYGE